MSRAFSRLLLATGARQAPVRALRSESANEPTHDPAADVGAVSASDAGMARRDRSLPTALALQSRALVGRVCTFELPDGRRCRATPLRDEPYCFWHSPDHTGGGGGGPTPGRSSPAAREDHRHGLRARWSRNGRWHTAATRHRRGRCPRTRELDRPSQDLDRRGHGGDPAPRGRRGRYQASFSRRYCRLHGRGRRAAPDVSSPMRGTPSPFTHGVGPGTVRPPLGSP